MKVYYANKGERLFNQEVGHEITIEKNIIAVCGAYAVCSTGISGTECNG